MPRAASLDRQVKPLRLDIFPLILLPDGERVGSGPQIGTAPSARAGSQPGEDVRAGDVLGRVGLAIPVEVTPGHIGEGT